MSDKEYAVFDHEGHWLGAAVSFEGCRKLHKEHYKNQPAILEKYAGLDCSGDKLKIGDAWPVFYTEE